MSTQVGISILFKRVGALKGPYVYVHFYLTPVFLCSNIVVSIFFDFVFMTFTRICLAMNAIHSTSSNSSKTKWHII